jgi:hypothetical protein
MNKCHGILRNIQVWTNDKLIRYIAYECTLTKVITDGIKPGRGLYFDKNGNKQIAAMELNVNENTA